MLWCLVEAFLPNFWPHLGCTFVADLGLEVTLRMTDLGLEDMLRASSRSGEHVLTHNLGLEFMFGSPLF